MVWNFTTTPLSEGTPRKRSVELYLLPPRISLVPGLAARPADSAALAYPEYGRINEHGVLL